MKPLLSSRHYWRLIGSETSLPDLVPRQTDIVRVSWGLGMVGIDAMLDGGKPVGPVLCCTPHQRLLVPVVSGTASWWNAPHSACGCGQSLQCSTQGPESPCLGLRLWLQPAGPVHATTDPHSLYDLLSLARTHLRQAAPRPAATSPRTVCHA
ncbi:hypothetical protein AB0N81_11100 [Streptomyces sp. NPDC093510]|uniref:hypothetical protein n=1 Tax=Streptomyces sp. NPDC093510 TaxID=3155199 RepID=UPI00342586C8